jgi:aminoglycoside phosphotransferase (APT) family kinase protein
MVTAQLRTWDVLDCGQQERLRELGLQWADSGVLRDAPQVLIHGDATPTQFLFPEDEGLVVIDFERLHQADPAADVGRVAGELKHLMTQGNGDCLSSESHIAHFYREYHRRSRHCGDFVALTQRARFHMACSELRIARNAWESLEHRRWLVEEAMRCLA